jgi:hypothetical protein
MNWKDQEEIDDTRVDMWTTMLFHYNLDLAAVHGKTGGNHVAAHRTTNPEIILQQVEGLMDQKNYDHLKRILVDGCPNVFNKEASYEQYLKKNGNHKSVEQNLEKVMKTMNKEDHKDHVLTFLPFLDEFNYDFIRHAPREEQLSSVQRILYPQPPVSTVQPFD